MIQTIPLHSNNYKPIWWSKQWNSTCKSLWTIKEKEREMKLTWSNKDSIMACTGRHRERERWWQGWLQVSWSKGENVTQQEHNIDTANLEVHCNTDWAYVTFYVTEGQMVQWETATWTQVLQKNPDMKELLYFNSTSLEFKKKKMTSIPIIPEEYMQKLMATWPDNEKSFNQN